MPKLKTHSGAKKSFNLNKTGKVKRAKAFKSQVAGIEINRKMLSEMAISNPAAFTQLIEIAKKA